MVVFTNIIREAEKRILKYAVYDLADVKSRNNINIIK